jgi:hypothetical protein
VALALSVVCFAPFFSPHPCPSSLRTLGAWSPHFQLLGFLVSAVPPASVTAVAVCQLGDPFLHCEEEREEAPSFLFFPSRGYVCSPCFFFPFLLHALLVLVSVAFSLVYGVLLFFSVRERFLYL